MGCLRTDIIKCVGGVHDCPPLDSEATAELALRSNCHLSECGRASSARGGLSSGAPSGRRLPAPGAPKAFQSNLRLCASRPSIIVVAGKTNLAPDATRSRRSLSAIFRKTWSPHWLRTKLATVGMRRTLSGTEPLNGSIRSELGGKGYLTKTSSKHCSWNAIPLKAQRPCCLAYSASMSSRVKPKATTFLRARRLEVVFRSPCPAFADAWLLESESRSFHSPTFSASGSLRNRLMSSPTVETPAGETSSPAAASWRAVQVLQVLKRWKRPLAG